MIPVGYVDVGILIDVASVGRAEVGEGDIAGKQFVVRPLVFVWVVTQKGNRHIVFIEDGDAALQLGDHGVVTPETHLARTAHMERDIAHELAVEVVMTETPVFAVAHQQQRLIVARVHSQAMAAIAQAVRLSLPGISRLIIAGLIELENARIAISIGDVDGTVRVPVQRQSGAIRSAREILLRSEQ